MHDALGSVVRRAATAACLILSFASHAAAQQPLAEPPAAPEFMSRFNFQMWAAGLSSDDVRFSWDTHWKGDFDFIDYVHGRMSFVADYEAVLGHERRLFDPSQGNYTLEVSGSWRLAGTEFAAVLHHVSRHLSDHQKIPAVAMNAMQIRVMHQVDEGPNSLALRIDSGPVIARALVDYSWLTYGEATFRRSVSPHVGFYGRGYADVWGVHKSVYHRSTQAGGRFEAGIRLNGKAAALELFGGYERVIDAYQLDLLPMRWAFAGFRLLN